MISQDYECQVVNIYKDMRQRKATNPLKQKIFDIFSTFLLFKVAVIFFLLVSVDFLLFS